MRGHRPTFHTTAGSHAKGEHYVTCQCRFYTERTPDRQGAEDLHLKHLRQIEQVRVHLRSKNPTLKSQRDYYQAMADDTRLPQHDRDLWQQLADELTHRLGSTENQEVPLW